MKTEEGFPLWMMDPTDHLLLDSTGSSPVTPSPLTEEEEDIIDSFNCYLTSNYSPNSEDNFMTIDSSFCHLQRQQQVSHRHHVMASVKLSKVPDEPVADNHQSWTTNHVASESCKVLGVELDLFRMPDDFGYSANPPPYPHHSQQPHQLHQLESSTQPTTSSHQVHQVISSCPGGSPEPDDGYSSSSSTLTFYSSSSLTSSNDDKMITLSSYPPPGIQLTDCHQVNGLVPSTTHASSDPVRVHRVSLKNQSKGMSGIKTKPPVTGNDKPIYACNYAGCSRIYNKSSHLKVHVRRHTGEKPFICTWPGCDWKFKRSDELSRHRRCHSGVKPYKCPDSKCSKAFGRSDHLAKHLKVHAKGAKTESSNRRRLATTNYSRQLV